VGKKHGKKIRILLIVKFQKNENLRVLKGCFLFFIWMLNCFEAFLNSLRALGLEIGNHQYSFDGSQICRVQNIGM